MKYPLVFYVDKLKNGFAGMANGPVVRIIKKKRKDEGLYAHELEHVKQWFYTVGLHSALYMVSKKYRLWSEVKAYRVQLKHSNNDSDQALFAGFIADKYNLSISEKKAFKLLDG